MPESLVIDSPIPAALRRSPRTVRRKPGTLLPLVVVRILTLPILLACGVLVGFVLLDSIVFFLIPAQPAHVIAQWSDIQPRKGASFFINYRLDRSALVAQAEVLRDEYRALQVGRSIKVHAIHLGPLHYSALDRRLSAYAHYRVILWLGALFAVTTGGAFFHSVWLSPWRAHWLTRHGQTTFGAVVEKRILHVRRLHGFFTLTYQFKAHGTLRAKRVRISPQRYDSAGVKDLVIILFDPARPNRSIVYDYCDFIAT